MDIDSSQIMAVVKHIGESFISIYSVLRGSPSCSRSIPVA